MNQKTQKQWREEHIKQTMEKLGITRKDYKRFLIVGNKLHRFYELNCNGYYGNEPIYKDNKIINAYTEEQYTKDTEPLYKKAELRAKDRGLYIFFQTDPRGATIYLSKEPIPENNYTIASVIY